jgi:hypothetical protein
VILAAHIDTASLAQGGASGAAMAKTSDQPQQTFSESLSVASKASPQADNASESGMRATNRKKSSSEDTESKSTVDQGAPAMSSVVSPLVVRPEQVVPVQQAQATPSDSVSPQLSLGNAVATTDTTTGMAAQPVDVLPSSAPSSKDSSQTASIPSDTGIQDLKASGSSLPDAANSARDADAQETTNTVSNVRSNEPPNAAANVSVDASSNAASSAGGDDDANSLQNPIQDAVLNAFTYVSHGTDSAPVLQSVHGASAAVALASVASDGPTNQANPLAIAPDQTVPLTDANASTTIANQIASVIGQSGGLAGMIHAGVSNSNMASTAEQSATSAGNGKTSSKDTAKDSTSDATGAKKHAEITADQSESQTGTQQTTPSTDRGQSDASSQGQNAVPIQINHANHSVEAVAQAQGTVIASTMPGASQHAGVTSTAAKSPLTAASVSDALPQTSPVINTAKLISTMGQSEMRVGMRSDEFGSISISTTASKDAITAQISLDHGELAKIISAQLPEMQARLGSSQSVNVRIDMNSNGAGQGADTSGSMANSSYSQSRGGGQQSTYAASSYASNNIVEGQLSPVVATATTGYGNVNSRLDIRV